ncbi:MAG: hypothetical protein WC752_01550, partial [Patescibacteria group bacterium]|jgi:SAM-dependent methyltransferase
MLEKKIKSEQIALTKLEQAFQAWQALPEATRGKFNSSWLKNNGYANVYEWSRRHSSIEALVALASPALQEAFSIIKKTSTANIPPPPVDEPTPAPAPAEPSDSRRTIESALSELQTAYNEWLTIPEEHRGKFNSKWLEKRSGGLYDWANRHGGMEALVAQASPELQAAFERQEREITSEQIALNKLEQAYEEWLVLSEETEDKFNSSWLIHKGYKNVYKWTTRHGGIEILIAKASPALQAAFEKQEREITSEQIALSKLAEAFQIWQNLSEASKDPFNSSWLIDNDYPQIYRWGRRHGGMEALVAKASPALQAAFEKQEREITSEQTALNKLEQAYEEWLVFSEGTEFKFNSNWLINNGYGKIYKWAGRHGGMEALVAKASLEIQRDFSFRSRSSQKGEPTESAESQLAPEPEPPLSPQTSPSPKSSKPARKKMAAGVLPSDMIDLSVISASSISLDIVASSFSAGASAREGGSRDVSDYTEEPTELQTLRFDIQKALRSGDWSDGLVDKYLEYHSYLPDFLFHHLAAADIIKRVQQGQIPMPKKVLSLAGGAYGEAIAWHRLLPEDLPMPAVVNADYSEAMLKKGKEVVSKKYGIDPEDLKRAIARIQDIEYFADEGEFDLIELSDTSIISEEELLELVEKIMDLLKPGQVFRLTSRVPLPANIEALLKSKQGNLLTPANASLKCNVRASSSMSEQERRRIQDKVGLGQRYIVVQKMAPKEHKVPESAPPETAHAPAPLEQRIRWAFTDLSKLPADERSAAALELADRFGTANIPDDLLASSGYRKEKRGKTWMLIKI